MLLFPADCLVSAYSVEERKEGRKIIDVKYTLFPTKEFIAEQKAANKRASDHLTVAKRSRIALVD